MARLRGDRKQKPDLPKSVTFQSLRRTAAFRISREVDILTYARIMGHSLQVAQDHYLDFDTMGAWGVKESLDPEEWEEAIARQLQIRSKNHSNKVGQS